MILNCRTVTGLWTLGVVQLLQVLDFGGFVSAQTWSSGNGNFTLKHCIGNDTKFDWAFVPSTPLPTSMTWTKSDNAGSFSVLVATYVVSTFSAQPPYDGPPVRVTRAGSTAEINLLNLISSDAGLYRVELGSSLLFGYADLVVGVAPTGSLNTVLQDSNTITCTGLLSRGTPKVNFVIKDPSGKIKVDAVSEALNVSYTIETDDRSGNYCCCIDGLAANCVSPGHSLERKCQCVEYQETPPTGCPPETTRICCDLILSAIVICAILSVTIIVLVVVLLILLICEKRVHLGLVEFLLKRWIAVIVVMSFAIILSLAFLIAIVVVCENCCEERYGAGIALCAIAAVLLLVYIVLKLTLKFYKGVNDNGSDPRRNKNDAVLSSIPANATQGRPLKTSGGAQNRRVNPRADQQLQVMLKDKVQQDTKMLVTFTAGKEKPPAEFQEGAEVNLTYEEKRDKFVGGTVQKVNLSDIMVAFENSRIILELDEDHRYELTCKRLPPNKLPSISPRPLPNFGKKDESTDHSPSDVNETTDNETRKKKKKGSKKKKKSPKKNQVDKEENDNADNS